jgi:hypothetical protein
MNLGEPRVNDTRELREGQNAKIYRHDNLKSHLQKRSLNPEGAGEGDRGPTEELAANCQGGANPQCVAFSNPLGGNSEALLSDRGRPRPPPPVPVSHFLQEPLNRSSFPAWSQLVLCCPPLRWR